MCTMGPSTTCRFAIALLSILSLASTAKGFTNQHQRQAFTPIVKPSWSNTRTDITSPVMTGAVALEPAPTRTVSSPASVVKVVASKISPTNIMDKVSSVDSVATMLSLTWVSAATYCVTVPLAWYTFALRTGLSPLAPGQWKGFLSVFAGIWVMTNFIKPVRFIVGLSLRSQFKSLILFAKEQMHVSTKLAAASTFVATHVLATGVLMSSGIVLASGIAGVPIIPR